jgi:hypothetical protein
MLSEWESFYLLTGSAAAALIGLLFIVATLMTDVPQSSAERGDKFYMTPIVFHLCVILVLSAMALAPVLTASVFGIACGLAAVVGVAYGAYVFQGIFNVRAEVTPHWSDKYCYGLGPTLAYVALALIAFGFLRNREWTAAGVASVLVVLLLLGIRNAWDLVTYLAPKQSEAAASIEDANKPA